MWKVFIFLLVVFTMNSVQAKCVSVATTTMCAKIPSYFGLGYFRPGTYTSNSWNFIYSDLGRDLCYWSGNYAEKLENGNVSCHMTSPFQMTLVVDLEYYGGSDDAYEICANHLRSMVFTQMLNISKLPGDICPDGFFTVPYELSCGVGYVDTTDAPNCSDDTTSSICLIRKVVPCASGISVLRTNTGLSFPIWATKNTSPALHISHNGTMCYVNLGPGKSPNAININIDGIIYHTMD